MMLEVSIVRQGVLNDAIGQELISLALDQVVRVKYHWLQSWVSLHNILDTHAKPNKSVIRSP